MKFKGISLKKNVDKTRRASAKRARIKLFAPPFAATPLKKGNAERVALIPFKTLATYRFSFPFGRNAGVREALMLNLSPITAGDQGENRNLSLVPQVTEHGRDFTKGTAWLVSKEEVAEWEKNLGSETALWPAPLAFSYAVGGSGLVLYKNDDGIAAVWTDKGEPILYRWQDSDAGSEEELSDWFRDYAKAQGKEISDGILICEGDITPELLEEAENHAVSSVPGLESLDLSSRWAIGAERAEALIGKMFGGMKALFAAGALFALCALALLIWNFNLKDEFAAAPAEAYRKSFGTSSAAPLASALKMERAAASGGTELSLRKLLGAVVSSWKEIPDSDGLKINHIRYAEERSEIEGLASGTELISALRDGIIKAGLTAKTGEVQQVAGSGLRFTVTVTGGQKR